jgi:hypothetical protein
MCNFLLLFLLHPASVVMDRESDNMGLVPYKFEPEYYVQTVLLFLLTRSFIRMMQTSYRGLLRKTKRSLPDVLSLNNSRFGDFFDRIYPIELEIKDTKDNKQ